MAAVIDSPPVVLSRVGDKFAKPAFASRDEGPSSLRQGPGESPDSSGDGRGVTSPIAVIIGLGTVELAPEAVPSALEKAVLRLGVREMGCSDDADVLCCSVGRSAPRPRLRTGVVGLISVCMRRGVPDAPWCVEW
jgi:hypothetical protein